MVFRYGVKQKIPTIPNTPLVGLQAASPHFSPLEAAALAWALMLQAPSVSPLISPAAILSNARLADGRKWA
jgi:hypothetical protein